MHAFLGETPERVGFERGATAECRSVLMSTAGGVID